MLLNLLKVKELKSINKTIIKIRRHLLDLNQMIKLSMILKTTAIQKHLTNTVQNIINMLGNAVIKESHLNLL